MLNLNVKKVLNKILQHVNGIQNPIRVYNSGLTVQPTTWTQISKVTLKAGGKYALLGFGTAGTVSNGSNIGISFNKVSGTASINYMGGTIGSTIGGGSKSAVAYVEATTDVEIELRIYLYGSGSTSTASGWMVAIPLSV